MSLALALCVQAAHALSGTWEQMEHALTKLTALGMRVVASYLGVCAGDAPPTAMRAWECAIASNEQIGEHDQISM